VRHADDGSWFVVDRGDLRVVASMSPAPQRVPIGAPTTGVLAAWDEVTPSGDTLSMPGHSAVVVSVR